MLGYGWSVYGDAENLRYCVSWLRVLPVIVHWHQRAKTLHMPVVRTTQQTKTFCLLSGLKRQKQCISSCWINRTKGNCTRQSNPPVHIHTTRALWVYRRMISTPVSASTIPANIPQWVGRLSPKRWNPTPVKKENKSMAGTRQYLDAHSLLYYNCPPSLSMCKSIHVEKNVLRR